MDETQGDRQVDVMALIGAHCIELRVVRDRWKDVLRICFVTWNGAGNRVPFIGLGRELQARGHQVVFAGYSTQQETIRSAGFDFRPLCRSDARWASYRAATPGLAEIVDAIWASSDHGADLDEVITNLKPDIIVVDFMLFGALAYLETLTIPWICLAHTAPGALAPPHGMLDQLVIEHLALVRRTIGLDPVPTLWEAWKRSSLICATIAELDPMAASAPSNFSYAGPVFPDATGDVPNTTSWEPPMALVSFSTGNGWDQRSRIERTLRALAGTEFNILVTSGMADLKGLDIPDNAIVQPYIPHFEVLPTAAVVITHAGHGTLCSALAHGIPVVALPNPGSDQPALANRAAELGAGLALDGEHSGPDEIGDAVRRVTRDRRYSDVAQTLAKRIAESPGRKSIADAILGSLKPL